MSAWIYRLGAFFASLPVSNLLIFALLISLELFFDAAHAVRVI